MRSGIPLSVGIKRLVAFDVGAAVHFAGCYYNFRL